MARLFQPTITRYVDSDGRRCLKDAPGARKVSEKSRTWRGEYRDYSGILRTVKLNANKQASRQMLAELERKAAQQKAGLLSPFEEHAQRPLLEHLAEFEQSLIDADNTEAHCKLVAARARKVIENTGFRFIRDISASKVQRCLADLKKAGKKKSQQTINHYLGAIKQFTRWLIRDHRTDEDRLIFLAGGNVRTDRPHRPSARTPGAIGGGDSVPAERGKIRQGSREDDRIPAVHALRDSTVNGPAGVRASKSDSRSL